MGMVEALAECQDSKSLCFFCFFSCAPLSWIACAQPDPKLKGHVDWPMGDWAVEVENGKVGLGPETENPCPCHPPASFQRSNVQVP